MNEERVKNCLDCNKKFDLTGYDYNCSEFNGKCSDCNQLEKRKSIPEKYALFMGVGKRHSMCTFDNFDGKEGNKIKALINKDLSENILIQSPNAGNGKTHLSVASLKLYGFINPKDHKFINFSNLMLEIKSTFNDSGLDETDIVKKYCDYQMLVIDDIGAEKSSEYAVSVLYIILNTRYEMVKPTMLTTNMSGEEIGSQYGKRILSRLRSGHLITLKTKDQRGIK